MSVELEFCSLIIPIEVIRKYYPGGYKKYKSERSHIFVPENFNVWFDDDLVREGSMGSDFDDKIQFWEELGVKTNKNDKAWKHPCVVAFTDPEFCKQLVFQEAPIAVSLKNENASVAQFSRRIDNKIINNLKATDLWTKKLSMDCLNGNVFLAIRPNNNISFYYNGGGLFDFGSKGFSTNVKYAAVIDKPFDGKIYEKDLPNAKLIGNFLDGYDRIKENCEQYSVKNERQGVSYIYHNYPYTSTSDKSNVVVLDIEITAPEDKDKRIDILLFNKKLKKLRFIEAKKFTNDEIKSKTEPQVIEQLKRYQYMIAERKDFLPAYQEYTDTLNKIFNLNLPKPLKIDDKLGLLIFGFDKDQKEGRLDKILKNLASLNFSIYPIGEIKNINAENLWKKTD